MLADKGIEKLVAVPGFHISLVGGLCKMYNKVKREGFMRNIIKAFLPVLLVSFILTGCGGGVSEDKPIAEVKTEAQGMSAEQLKATVSKYQAAIDSKKAEINKLTAQVQQIPIAQMMGDEAKKLKGEIQNIGNSVKALTERLNIYAQEIKSKM